MMKLRMSFLTLLALGLSHGAATAEDGATIFDTDNALLQRLTFEGSLDHDATWSPDGAWIVYVSEGEKGKRLWKISTGGGEARQLTFGEEEFLDWYPHWSPDGDRIAFTSNREGGTRVWTIPAAGGTPQKITPQPLNIRVGQTSSATWSPDGRYIAYAARVDGNADIWHGSIKGSSLAWPFMGIKHC